MDDRESRFRRAVKACPDLTLRDGLQAVSPANRERIRPKEPRSVTGSVDIDEDLRELLPTDNRWDYAVGYRGNENREKAFFYRGAFSGNQRNTLRRSQSAKLKSMG